MLTAVRQIPLDPRQNLWQAWEAAEIVSTGGPCEKTLGYMETEQVMGCLLVYILKDMSNLFLVWVVVCGCVSYIFRTYFCSNCN